jgi:hypothetical protein
MNIEPLIVLRFMALYAMLFSAFGFASPFLPAFLAERGLGPEEVGLVLGAATALRLICGPVAGNVAMIGCVSAVFVCSIESVTAVLNHRNRLWRPLCGPTPQSVRYPTKLLDLT